MNNIFAFLNAAPYEERVVDRYESENLKVSTAVINDSVKLYETAVCHREYNGGAWVMVEHYDSKEEAQRGHDKWVLTMTQEPLPAQLVDVNIREGSGMIIGELLSAAGGSGIFERQPQ